MATKLVLLVIASTFATTFAQREPTIGVMTALKELQPRYREIQDFVINRLTEARLNSSQVVYNFHNDIIGSKDEYVRGAIAEEQTVLTILDGQQPDVDRTCLGFVRNSVDMNVNLVGVSYTNCINTVDDRLGGIVQKFYATIQEDESQYTGTGLFGVFRGENIFYAPENIVEKLNEKLEQLRDNPTYIANELFDMVVEFEAELGEVKEVYEGCLEVGTQLLLTTLNIARTQIVQVCQGQLEPETPTDNPAEQ